jgi:SAM-dependent methyltransferase
MFFPDRVVAYREALRVLKPGGRFLFSVWDGLSENEIPAAVTDVVAAMLPAGTLPFLARLPHGYHDAAIIERDLRNAGFGRIEIETVTKRSRAPSPRHAAVGLCEGTPMRAEIEAAAPGRLAETTEAATAAVAAKYGEGSIDGKIQAIVVSAEPICVKSARHR